jgi:hypothetical protein
LGLAELLGPTTSTAGSMLSAPPGCVTLIILSSDTVIVHDTTYIVGIFLFQYQNLIKALLVVNFHVTVSNNIGDYMHNCCNNLGFFIKSLFHLIW